MMIMMMMLMIFVVLFLFVILRILRIVKFSGDCSGIGRLLKNRVIVWESGDCLAFG